MLVRRSRFVCAVIMIISFIVTASSQTSEFKKGTYTATAYGATWAIKYDDNKVSLARNGEIFIEGVYKVTGNEIEVTDERGPMACRDDQKTGKYTWKLEGKSLTFQKVKDECAGRANALTSIPWIRE